MNPFFSLRVHPVDVQLGVGVAALGLAGDLQIGPDFDRRRLTGRHQSSVRREKPRFFGQFDEVELNFDVSARRQIEVNPASVEPGVRRRQRVDFEVGFEDFHAAGFRLDAGFLDVKRGSIAQNASFHPMSAAGHSIHGALRVPHVEAVDGRAEDVLVPQDQFGRVLGLQRGRFAGDLSRVPDNAGYNIAF